MIGQSRNGVGKRRLRIDLRVFCGYGGVSQLQGLFCFALNQHVKYSIKPGRIPFGLVSELLVHRSRERVVEQSGSLLSGQAGVAACHLGYPFVPFQAPADGVMPRSPR